MAFHEEWFRNQEYLPLSPLRVEAVSAMAKRGGYRSWGNYLSRAKSQHVREGHHWTDQLELAFKEAKRSVERGQGPARQSAPLDVVAVASQSVGFEPIHGDWPVNPKGLFVMGSMFMMREIEISLTRVCHIKLNVASGTLAWLLPASKTDPKALSVTRTWSCVCAVRPELCPVHIMEQRLSSFMHVASDTPLFPSFSGDFPEKDSVVKSIEHLAALLGVSVLDDNGRSGFGGHSMRVSGAQYLSSIGLGESLIALLARWMSPTIKRYVGESPLHVLGREFEKAVTSTESGWTTSVPMNAPSTESKQAIAHLQSLLLKQETEHHSSMNELKQLRERFELLDAPCKINFIVNMETYVGHKVAYMSLDSPAKDWRTACGWPFAGAGCSYRSWTVDDFTAKPCKNCFRAELLGGEVRGSERASTSSSSSSSSE